MAVDLVLLQRQANPRSFDRSPPFSLARVRKPTSLRVTPAEKVEVTMLMERVVQRIHEGVTGMDLLEIFLSRCIQPLQARDHSMWMYLGIEDSTRIHPEDVDEKMVAHWVQGITGNKDNPRGSRRVLPFNANHQLDQVNSLFPSVFHSDLQWSTESTIL